MRRKISAVVWARSEWLRAIAARGILIFALPVLVLLGTAGPVSAASSASAPEEVFSTQQAAPLTGRVEHLSGRPVADASVRVYHIPSDDFLEGERLATTRTDQQGRYRLTRFAEADLQSLRERYPGFVLLVARAPDDGWFQVDLSQSADFFDDRDLGTTLLSRQLLLAPTPARLKTKPLGVATVWRHVARGDRTQQTVYVEITDVADDPQRPAYQLGGPGQPLTQGAFTAAVPEEGVRVHYDRVDLFRALVGSSPGPLESGSGEATPVARWHPTRTDLPVYAFTRALETKTFTSYTERQRREAERYRSYRRLLIEEIAGAAPFASIGLSFIQVVADLSEESPGPSTTVGSGGSPVDLNRQDRIEDGWIGDAHSVVFEIPMTLRPGPQAPYPVELRAAWSEGQAQLAHRVELDFIEKQPEPEPGAPRQPQPPGETVVVNALERGASAEVHQPTWVYNEDRDIGPEGMIDDDPSTQWEVKGNPAEIEAIFRLPRPARVTGDYIHVGGTGGNRDITEYHLMVRRNGTWVRATTIQGSITGDGTPDVAHTFDDPITGQHFKIVITQHTAPRLCYDQCDVPIAEYQLKGNYIDEPESESVIHVGSMLPMSSVEGAQVQVVTVDGDALGPKTTGKEGSVRFSVSPDRVLTVQTVHEDFAPQVYSPMLQTRGPGTDAQDAGIRVDLVPLGAADGQDETTEGTRRSWDDIAEQVVNVVIKLEDVKTAAELATEAAGATKLLSLPGLLEYEFVLRDGVPWMAIKGEFVRKANEVLMGGCHRTEDGGVMCPAEGYAAK